MPMDTPNPLSRRQFLHTLTLVGTAALLPLAATAQTAPATPAPAAPVPVGADADFTEGDFKPITLPSGSLIFVGRQNGKLLALSSVCTHRGCTVAWTADQKQFICPCHNGRFDTAGTNVGGPPKRPLAVYTVTVTDGKVMVQA